MHLVAVVVMIDPGMSLRWVIAVSSIWEKSSTILFNFGSVSYYTFYPTAGCQREIPSELVCSPW